MSVYDNRTTPAYNWGEVPLEYSENPQILSWWEITHDELIKSLIEEHQWNWPWFVTDKIVLNTPKNTIELWKNTDPLCKQYAWYNILMYFAISRANRLKLSDNIRKPRLIVCAFCGLEFNEDSVPAPFIAKMGINRIDICSPCLKNAIFEPNYMQQPTKSTIIAYIQHLTEIAQQIPHQNFGELTPDLLGLSTEERVNVLRVIIGRPRLEVVKKIFGSWFKALIASGVLNDDAVRLGRGIKCLAQDGHECYSMGEKTIDDFLYKQGIPHTKEPKYPEGNYRADFRVDNYLIEYFGLAGDDEYDKKTAIKMEICRRHGVNLIAIYPKDLASISRLRKLLSAIIAR